MDIKLNTTPKGWECPKCGAVMAPFMTECVNNKEHTQVTATITIGTSTWTTEPITTTNKEYGIDLNPTQSPVTSPTYRFTHPIEKPVTWAHCAPPTWASRF